VDFPLDGYGTPIDSVWERWLEHDPGRLADVLTPAIAPAIYFDCGTYDDFLLHPFNVDLDAHLTGLGIPHQFVSYAGNHWNQITNRYMVSLRFLDSAMGNPASGIAPCSEDHRTMVSVIQPNPARLATTIHYKTVVADRVKLQVFDASGRLTVTLLDAEVTAGEHQSRWDVRGVPAGAYFVRLSTRSGQDSRVLIVGN
jgi:hypothetical protein